MADPDKQAKRLARLERARAGGMWRYVILAGVVGWGVTVAILFSLFVGGWTWDGFLSELKTAIVIFPIAGVLFGFFMWNLVNREWQKLQG